MLFRLLLAFTLIPMIELYFLIRAGKVWGVGNTIGIVILTGVVGAWLSRSQGRQVLAQLQVKMARGEVPAREALEGVLIFMGGLLLLTPGFVTDALGLSMVVPGVRSLWAVYMLKQIEKGVRSGRWSVSTSTSGPQGFVYYSRDFGQRPPPRDVSSRQIIDVESQPVEDRPSDPPKSE